jgi:hypothetical protein
VRERDHSARGKETLCGERFAGYQLQVKPARGIGTQDAINEVRN